MTDTAYLGLTQTLEENPQDTTAHLVLADWLEENGRHEEASFHRWVSREQLAPYSNSPVHFSWTYKSNSWLFTDAARYRKVGKCGLPKQLSRELCRYQGIGESYWTCCYSSQQDAYEALLMGWRDLPPSKRPR